MIDLGQPAPPSPFASHPRNWRQNRYIYPVCSRRSGGLSIGINLNPDQSCNFNCVYCQVDRSEPACPPGPIDLHVLRTELADMLAEAAAGRLAEQPEFRDLPSALQQVRDVAFSGNGEPTACPQFAQAVHIADELVAGAGLDLKLVLLTNASLLDRPAVRNGLEALHHRGGEIWAKLDAGTAAHFRRINRTTFPVQRILANITLAAQRWPIVIQSCFVRLDGQGPDAAEIDAYCDRLSEILAAGGQIKLVQVHTVARRPAEPYVTALPMDALDQIVSQISRRLPALKIRAFYAPA